MTACQGVMPSVGGIEAGVAGVRVGVGVRVVVRVGVALGSGLALLLRRRRHDPTAGS